MWPKWNLLLVQSLSVSSPWLSFLLLWTTACAWWLNVIMTGRETDSCFLGYLAVGIDHRSQQFPGSSSSVHPDHPQDLKEPKRPNRWGRKDVPLSPRSQDGDGCYQYHDVWERHRSDREIKTGQRMSFCFKHQNHRLCFIKNKIKIPPSSTICPVF